MFYYKPFFFCDFNSVVSIKMSPLKRKEGVQPAQVILFIIRWKPCIYIFLTLSRDFFVFHVA